VSPALDAEPGRNVEQELNIRVFSELDAALAQCPDIAIIANPTSLHVDTAIACLRAGCDIFVEKPLSARWDGVDELTSLAASRHRIAMVGYQLRFHPCLRALAAALGDGTLGRLLAVRAAIGEYLPGFHPYEDYRELYAAKQHLGGGVVLSQIHEFDYLYSLFGAVRSVYALGGHWSTLDIDVEDVSSALLEGVHEGRSLPIHVQQDYLQVPAVRLCEVIGEAGAVVADFSGLRVTVSHRTGTTRTMSFETFERNTMFLEELRHFLHCCETRQRPVVDLLEGAQSLRIALAVRESIASGAVVRLGG
jgi:predicted dehydrogenase